MIETDSNKKVINKYGSFFSFLYQVKSRKISNRFPIFSFILLQCFFLIFISGCIRRRAAIIVPIDFRSVFSDSGTVETPDKWWTVFNDLKLNKLIDNALESNLDLKTAWQRLNAAQAVVKSESGSLMPDLEGSLRGEMGRTESESEKYEDLQLSLSSEYELDLWGRIRSGVEAERYQARASFFDYRAIAISLTAEITRSWFKLVEARNQIRLIEEQIDINEKMLRLIKNRVGIGQIRSVDILRQKGLVESTREQKIIWESRAMVLEHQLSVLQGLQPGENEVRVNGNLPGLPPLPETGVPAELIQRRPDVQSAFFRVKSADRQIASAISSRYPRLSLSATISSTTESSNNLIKDWARSLVGNLLAPIFQGGRLSAEVRRTRAVKKQRLYEYGQIILDAFQEVEDAMIQEKKQTERIHSLEMQVVMAKKTYDQLRIEYFNGISDYLDVLESASHEQQQQREILSANMVLLEYRISLYRALAGGFITMMESENGR